MDDLGKKISGLIAQCISMDEVYIETNLKNDLGVDSSEMVEIAVTLEKELGVKIDNCELKKITIIKDCVEYLRTLLDRKSTHSW
jgi:acyl carrier protein